MKSRLARIIFVIASIVLCASVLFSCAESRQKTFSFTVLNVIDLQLTASNRWREEDSDRDLSLVYGNDLAYTGITARRFNTFDDDNPFVPHAALSGVIEEALKMRENIELLNKTEHIANGLTIRSWWYRADFQGSTTFYCFSYMLFDDNRHIYLLVVQSMREIFYKDMWEEAVMALRGITIVNETNEE